LYYLRLLLLVSSTSTIANGDPSGAVWKEAEAQFWWLFWGVVPMVADDQVGSAVNAFSEAVDEHREVKPLHIPNGGR
jgi:hypothetical protein